MRLAGRKDFGMAQIEIFLPKHKGCNLSALKKTVPGVGKRTVFYDTQKQPLAVIDRGFSPIPRTLVYRPNKEGKWLSSTGESLNPSDFAWKAMMGI